MALSPSYSLDHNFRRNHRFYFFRDSFLPKQRIHSNSRISLQTMVTTTRKASNAPRKCFPSQKAEQNSEKLAARPKKCIKVVPIINSDDIIEDISTDDERPASGMIEAPEDVSMQKYTLAVSLMLEEISIYVAHRFINLVSSSIENLKKIQSNDCVKLL